MFIQRASETSEADSQSCSIEISDIHNWRASVASETLTGVTQSKIGDVCLFIYLFIYMDVRMSSRFCVSYVVDPVPNCTKQNPLVYRSVPVSP